MCSRFGLISRVSRFGSFQPGFTLPLALSPNAKIKFVWPKIYIFGEIKWRKKKKIGGGFTGI